VRVVRPGGSVELLEAQLSAGGRPVDDRPRVAPAGAERPQAGADARAARRPDEETPPPARLRLRPRGRDALRGAAAGSSPARDRVDAPEGARRRRRGADAVQRVLAVADSGNGISAVMGWDDWLFINPS
jgi:hypothetical protein